MAPALLEVVYTLVTVTLLVIFFYLSLRIRSDLKKTMLLWLLFGFLFSLFSFSWLYTVYPLIWMPEGLLQLVGIGVLHIIVSTVSSVPFLFVGYVVYQTHNTHIHVRPFLIAFSFVVAEMIRAILLSLLFLGKGTTIGLHFTAGTIGNALSTTPLIELAYYGGTFALTFFLTYCISTVLTIPTRTLSKHLFFIGLLYLYTHFLPVVAPERDLVLGVITTNVKTSSDKELRESFMKSNELIIPMILGDKNRKDFIIAPEDSRLSRSLNKEHLAELKLSQPFATLIDGDTLRINGGLTNVSLVIDMRGTSTFWRGKSFLLPLNEYVPYAFDTIFRFFIGEKVDMYKKNHTYTPIHSNKAFTSRGITVGTLICSEILSHSTIKQLGEEGPSVIFYQSRLNVFNNNPWFIMQLRSFTKVAAAQLRTTIISSTNYAPSYMVNGRGELVYEIPASVSYKEILLTKGGEVILK